MSIATEEQQVVEKVQNKLYIGGEWRDATGGGTLEVEDPSTGETIAEVADGTAADAERAVAAALAAYRRGDWSRITPAARAEVLDRLAGLLEERADDFGERLGHALTLDRPSLIVLPIDYSIDVAISEELGTETVAT